jgi:hypothetical protein
MKKVTLLLLLLLIVFLRPITFLHADTTSVRFITKPQTILPSALSQAITIETDDALNKPFAVAETMDISFQTSSPTGKFVTSTGTLAGHVMAKGTAHKTFYYVDNTLGTYTLVVTATGRTSKQKYSATQQITISSILPDVTPVVAIPKATKVKLVKTSTTSTDVLGLPLSSQTIVSSTDNTAVVYEAKPQTPIFDTMLSWPRKLWQWFAKLF